MNGKGDSPRSCFSKKFKSNYDNINWGRPKTIDEVCDVPKGSFQRSLKESEQKLKEQEKLRQKRIRKANADKPYSAFVCSYCGKEYCWCESEFS